MSDLQLSLLVIGAVVVGAVYLYNWLQERSFHRGMQQAFGSAHDDVLLKAGVESALTDGRLEPQIVPPEEDQEGRTAPAAFADRGQASAPGFDPAIDYVAEVDADTPIADAQLGELASQAASCGKPVHIAGLDAGTGEWGDIARGEVGRYVSLRLALQLVNRAGPVNSAQLAMFCDGIKSCADRIPARSAFPDAPRALKRARDLDTFCAGVDVAVGVNVVAEGSGKFAGARIRELAQAAGFKLESDGVFHYRDEHRQTLFTLDNHEPAPFLPERIQGLTTRGVTLLLDVPRAAAGIEVLDRMVGIANSFATALGGRLVDDNRAALSEAGIARIREQVRSIHATMEAHGIPAGSSRALRLFSG
jgi:hypothetical protein